MFYQIYVWANGYYLTLTFLKKICAAITFMNISIG